MFTLADGLIKMICFKMLKDFFFTLFKYQQKKEVEEHDECLKPGKKSDG